MSFADLVRAAEQAWPLLLAEVLRWDLAARRRQLGHWISEVPACIYAGLVRKLWGTGEPIDAACALAAIALKRNEGTMGRTPLSRSAGL